MATRAKSKKIRKVIHIINEDLAAATDNAVSIHTVTDPGTTKRFICGVDLGEDAFAADNEVRWGLCITGAGETLPDLANAAAEENRWLAIGVGLAKAQADGAGVNVRLDSKIQRKVKDGHVISFVGRQSTVGKMRGSVTLFIDES